MKIAVFCASANLVEDVFFEAARELGKRIGEEKWQLVYGGTNIGLMREVSESAMQTGAWVTGVIPECIKNRGVAATDINELVVTTDMKERKHILREQADAFIALPGGWGTLEEITEVITLKQLGIHHKPVVFLNIAGYYDLFRNFIEEIRLKGFVSSTYEHLYYYAEKVEDAIEYIRKYEPEHIEDKY